MAHGTRSPFGALLHRHRLRMGLSQARLAARAHRLYLSQSDFDSVSARTVLELERPATDPSRWRTPRISTVHTLAEIFGLVPGSPAHEEFLSAATTRRGSGPLDAALPASQQPSDLPVPPMLEFLAAGRELHLARLQRTIRDATRDTPGFVLVSADQGSGKSWLIAHACRTVLETHPELVVIWTDCSRQPDANNTSRFHHRLLGTMLGDLEGIGPDERLSNTNVARLQQRIPHAVDALLAHGDDLFHHAVPATALRNPLLLAAIDDDRTQGLRRAADIARGSPATEGDIVEQLFRVLQAYAASGPVVLVVEDLHWADAGVANALSHLTTRMAGRRLPLAVIGSLRPGELGPDADRRPHPLPPVIYGATRRYPDLMLDLSQSVGGEAGREFLDAKVARLPGELPVEVVDYLYEKTDGLALFVSSVLAMLAERDDLSLVAPEDRSVSIQAFLETLPLDIDAAFAQQLSSLPDPLLTLLRIASVQGTTFSAEVVMRIAEMSDADWFVQVDQVLGSERRLVFSGGVSHIAGQSSHEYHFWHAMLRDYLYDGLKGVQRSRYHRATADALIGLYGERGHAATSSIAFHLEQSGEAARSARAWIHAGDWVYSEADHLTARGHFQRATELLRPAEAPATFAEALIGMSNCARALVNPDEARALVDRALAIAQRRYLLEVAANALSVKGMVEFDAGELDAGAGHHSQAIDQYLAAGNQAAAGHSMANLSYTLHGMGRYEDAMAFANRGLEVAKTIGNDYILIDATVALANCWINLGLYHDALEAYGQCRVVCDDLGDTHRDSLCLMNTALCCLETSDWKRGAAAIEAVTDPDRAAAIRLVAAAELYMGLIAEERGDDLERVRGYYERSRRIREKTGQHALLIDSLAGLLRVALLAGRLDEAAALLAEISGYLNERGIDGIEHYGRLFVTLVDACQALGRDVDAVAYLNQGIALLTTRADGLRNPNHRQSYLRKVPAHRRILELADQVGHGGMIAGKPAEEDGRGDRRQ